MKAAWKTGGVEGYRRLLERKRDEWENIPVNVAVIGNTGVGKSSFINAIRGLTADDEGAEVGVVEIRSYPHPYNRMLMFWDLPGVGTDEFPRETYLSEVGVDRYDFFLLLTADRFTENDTWLGDELRKRNKKYFFVRTNIGVEISDTKKAHPSSDDEEAMIEQIRQYTADYLRQSPCASRGDVQIFLIDSYEPNKFDFVKLKKQIIIDFPTQKRSALMRALQSTSEEMIMLKMADLRSRIWMSAALSAAGGAIPFPGASLAIDYTIITHEAKSYFRQLGLDSESTVMPIRCMLLLGAAAAEEGFKVYLPLLPVVFSSVIAGSMSYWATYATLKLILDKCENLALTAIEDIADRLES